jgi:hypothetical protein
MKCKLSSIFLILFCFDAFSKNTIIFSCESTFQDLRANVYFSILKEVEVSVYKGQQSTSYNLKLIGLFDKQRALSPAIQMTFRKDQKCVGDFGIKVDDQFYRDMRVRISLLNSKPSAFMEWKKEAGFIPCKINTFRLQDFNLLFKKEELSRPK